MSAGTTPIFPIAPSTVSSQVSVANTNRDGTGTVVTAYTAGANGSLVDFVRIKARGSTSDGMIRLFSYDGTNYRLLDEIKVPPTSPPGTQPTWQYDWFPPAPPNVPPSGLALKNGYSLRASTHVGETFDLLIHGGDY